ncbi:hypothetical protein SAMN05421578_101503 [Paenibacillus macquariensis]|uniref:Uncharacterized protein n=1 Tax=Paenibacillus macquariensis TaxID=948756 RepID=A0ABY1JLA7_9BACL|nr:hypothetical protein SAMN05421578_101503 [Paenibacillus macquariensis]
MVHQKKHGVCIVSVMFLLILDKGLPLPIGLPKL